MKLVCIRNRIKNVAHVTLPSVFKTFDFELFNLELLPDVLTWSQSSCQNNE